MDLPSHDEESTQGIEWIKAQEHMDWKVRRVQNIWKWENSGIHRTLEQKTRNCICKKWYDNQ